MVGGRDPSDPVDRLGHSIVLRWRWFTTRAPHLLFVVTGEVFVLSGSRITVGDFPLPILVGSGPLVLLEVTFCRRFCTDSSIGAVVIWDSSGTVEALLMSWIGCLSRWLPFALHR